MTIKDARRFAQEHERTAQETYLRKQLALANDYASAWADAAERERNRKGGLESVAIEMANRSNDWYALAMGYLEDLEALK